MNQAAVDLLTKDDKTGEWHLPMNVGYARRIEDSEREAVEKQLNNMVNKKDIAKNLGTNCYQLNRSLKRWYGTSVYKNILLKLKNE